MINNLEYSRNDEMLPGKSDEESMIRSDTDSPNIESSEYFSCQKLSHENVLSALLSELKPLDFSDIVQGVSGEFVSQKHIHVIAVEHILKMAKLRKWSLCTHNGTIYVYNGEYWKVIYKDPLKKFLGEASERLGVDRFEARHFTFREALMKQFWASAYFPKPEKKIDEITINFQNGTFVINGDKQYLREFRRDDFMTYQLPFKFDPDAVAPEFEKYLDRVQKDKLMQDVLSEYIGYVLIPNSTLSLEKALVLIGSGANGKSVFFSIITALLGSQNTSSYGLESLTSINGYHRAMLTNYLLNYAPEISPSMDSTIFKQMISGEPVEARLPYQEPFIMTNYARFIFNTNQLPKDVEQNEAFFRRFLLVRFDVTIPSEERDPELAKRIISSELPGVFNWVLKGLQRLLMQKKFTHSKAIDDALEDYKKQSDTVRLFIDDVAYIIDHNNEIYVSDVYSEFKHYCQDFGYKICSLKSFTERLKFMGCIITRKSRGNVVGLKNIS